ncbi:MAG TPA: hypothetical protein DDW71_11020 [Lactobacillus sp.]|nr:hypothetical protein [Lactobacillus sp.]
MTDSYSVYDIAEWFLKKEPMSDKKVQKLTYYAVAWGWALLHCSIINDDRFQAWVHGPVSPKLYARYRDCGWNPIPQPDDTPEFDQQTTDLLESVWATYGDKDANELEALTHTEQPWQNARRGYEPNQNSKKVIDTDDMRNFYLSIYNGD